MNMSDEAEIADRIRQAEDKADVLEALQSALGISKKRLREIAVAHQALRPWSEAAARNLYGSGYTDEQLCNAFGYTEFVIRQWRTRNGLPPHYQKVELPQVDDTDVSAASIIMMAEAQCNPPKVDKPKDEKPEPKTKGRVSVIDDAKALTLYRAGASDKRIAVEFGLHTSRAGQLWRRRMGLPPHPEFARAPRGPQKRGAAS